MKKLFGTDGIRGPANEYPITPEMALRIGRATALLFQQRGRKTRIVVGKDTRISGDMLEHALISGICSVGADALWVGVLPTPGVAFITKSMDLSAGIMISASHNPFHDNGIKIFSGDGFKLSDDMEAKIEQLVVNNNVTIDGYDKPRVLGKAQQIGDAQGRYVAFLKGVIPNAETLEGLSIVVDCSNGATFQVARTTLMGLGATVKTLFSEPDGTNINLNCGSEHLESLIEEVVSTKADVGFAFDGDGDRVIAVDEKGGRVTGDQILALCAKEMKDRGRLRNNLAVSTVMSNIGLGLALKGWGIEHVTTQVGDRYVLQEMMVRGASLGGEDSGHMIFLDEHTTGDGIITALQIVRAMKSTGSRLSELAKLVEIFPQRMINVEVKDKPPIETVPEIASAIERVETILGDVGRVLVRYSGTQPMCRVMVEGPSHEETEKYCSEIAQVVKKKLG